MPIFRYVVVVEKSKSTYLRLRKTKLLTNAITREILLSIPFTRRRQLKRILSSSTWNRHLVWKRSLNHLSWYQSSKCLKISEPSQWTHASPEKCSTIMSVPVKNSTHTAREPKENTLSPLTQSCRLGKPYKTGRQHRATSNKSSKISLERKCSTGKKFRARILNRKWKHVTALAACRQLSWAAIFQCTASLLLRDRIRAHQSSLRVPLNNASSTSNNPIWSTQFFQTCKISPFMKIRKKTPSKGQQVWIRKVNRKSRKRTTPMPLSCRFSAKTTPPSLPLIETALLEIMEISSTLAMTEQIPTSIGSETENSSFRKSIHRLKNCNYPSQMNFWMLCCSTLFHQ